MSTQALADGQVRLTYYAHCAFLWQTPQGVRVLTDPYRNQHDRNACGTALQPEW